MPLGYGGAQPLGGFTDGKREGRILLYPAEMFHRVPAPSTNVEAVQPPVGRQRHGPPGADSGPSVVGILPGRLGHCEFLFNECRSFHEASVPLRLVGAD